MLCEHDRLDSHDKHKVLLGKWNDRSTNDVNYGTADLCAQNYDYVARYLHCYSRLCGGYWIVDGTIT